VNNRPLTALFLDFDSYFASVEQHLQPALRGKPVGVAPVMAATSCCIAASYEAKAFGVKTGTGVREAHQLCPGITIVPARPDEYVRHHHRLIAAVEECIHVETVLSIDEMWCWLPYNLRQPHQILAIAENIKATIARTVSSHITCSIGVSTNRWLAKMASKMRKPNGMMILSDSDMPEAFHELKLRDIHGVGRSMELRLHANGIHSVAELCAASRQTLHGIWGGIGGDRFWLNLHGFDVPEVETSRQSIGHSHVLAPDKRTPDKALPILHKLTQKAATRLRAYEMLAGSLSIYLKYFNRPGWKAELHFEASADSLLFAKVVQRLWSQRPDPGESVLQVSMVLGRLIERSNHTPSLFAREDAARLRLNDAMDTIRSKYGRKAIHLGCDHDTLDAAPMRISFTHIPDLELENDD